MTTDKELIEWSQELSVGIEGIDEQHKVLVRLINELHDAILHRRGSVACRSTLTELVKYTQVHFTDEENFMASFHYPEYKRHKEEHDRLIEHLLDLQKKLDSGKANISFELLHFLKTWLYGHIAHNDKKYVPFFIAEEKKQPRPSGSPFGKLKKLFLPERRAK